MVFALLTLLNLVAAYDGPTGYWQSGASWTGTCATGTMQSPIAVDTASSTVLHQREHGFKLLRLAYSPDTVQSHITGSKFEIFGNFGSLVRVDESDNEEFTATVDRIDFKAPAEHLVESSSADLEMQIAHRFIGAGGLQAVLVVQYRISDEKDPNPFIASVVDSVSSPQNIDLPLAFGRMLSIFNYFFYEGSLTAPPCSEPVLWYLWAETQTISREQAAFFSKLWQGNTAFAGGMGNNRVLQNRGERDVTRFVGDQTDFGAAHWVGLSAAALWTLT